MLDRIGADGIGTAGMAGSRLCGRENEIQGICSSSAESWPKQLQLYPFDAAPIDRFDSFDVVFGVFLVQDLALFC